jgi:uncharacterized membrane protein SpoIIM required for sporulation
MPVRSLVLVVLATWGLFLLGCWSGYVSFDLAPVHLHPLQLAGGQAFWEIIATNTPTALIIALASLFTFGLAGAIMIFIIGATTGSLVHAALFAHWTPGLVLLALLPHGLLEISSFGIFLGTGAFWPFSALRHWLYAAPWPEHPALRRTLWQGLAALLLLVLAALIESYLTPLLIHHL